MTREEALAARAELERQLHKTRTDYAHLAAERQRLTARLSPAKTAVTVAYRNHMRGIDESGDNLREAEEAARAVEAELKRINTREQVALAASNDVEAELTGLLREQFEHFAPAAEEKTKLAAEEMQRFSKAFAAAQRKWEEAAREWKPLAKAVGVPGAPPFPVRAAPDTWVAEPRPARIVPNLA